MCSLSNEDLIKLRMCVDESFHIRSIEKIKMVLERQGSIIKQKDIASRLEVSESDLSLYLNSKQRRKKMVFQWFHYLWTHCQLFTIDVCDLSSIIQEIIEKRENLPEKRVELSHVIDQKLTFRITLIMSIIDSSRKLDSHLDDCAHDKNFEMALVSNILACCSSYLNYNK